MITAEELQEIKEAYPGFFWKPFNWQKLKLLPLVREKRITVIPAPNKIGKTASCAMVVISWLLGYETWTANYVGDDFIEIEGCRYRISSLGKQPPVNIRIGGEDWETHIKSVIIPELKKWLVGVPYEPPTRNNAGAEVYWKFPNGSTITIMSYNQEDSIWEGFISDGFWFDEPPPQSKFVNAQRALMVSGGKTIMSMTPLKEAWVLDELVLSGRSDVGVVTDLTIMNNPNFYNNDKQLLVDMGLDVEQIKGYFEHIMEFKKGRDYLNRFITESQIDLFEGKAIIEPFILSIPEKDRMARVRGQFACLAGLVLKDFDPNKHIIEPFTVPNNWIITCGIDVHINKPHAVSFYAVDERGIRYVIDEIWENMNVEVMADRIIRKKKQNLWRLERVFIDPLSKGDSAFVKNRLGVVEDTYTTLSRLLSQEGMMLEVGCKDKDSGINNLKSWLKGANLMPSLYIFNTCKRHLYEIARWVYDDNEKPAKINDDMMENLYRYSLMGVVYVDKRTLTFDRGKNIDRGVV